MNGYAIQKSTASQPLVFLMVDSADHVSGKTGLAPTVTISKNGGAFASTTGAVSEIGNGLYAVAANATDSNTLGPLILHATASGADPVDWLYPVVAYDPLAVALGAMLSYTQPTGFLAATFPSDPADQSIIVAATDAILTAVGTRLATAGYTAPDNASVTAIKAKTDNLPSDPADQSAVEAAITAATSPLATAASIAIISDGVGFLTSVAMGAISDAGTAGETYVITFGGSTYTVDYTGLDATGNRGTTTRTKS